MQARVSSGAARMAFRLGAIAALVLCGMVCALAPAAPAQQPTYLDPKPLWDESNRDDYRKYRERESLVRNIMNDRAPLDQHRAEFDEFFRRHVFVKMASASGVGKLAELRRDFFKTHFHSANPPQAAHDHLVQLTFDTMQRVAVDGRFHPAVRYNAMLIIGELNEQESTGIGPNRRPPVPLTPALNFMLAQLNDPKQIDEVRIAALVGILRHTQTNRTLRQLNVGQTNEAQQQANAQRIISAMLQIAEQKEPPEGRSLEGHTWMRRRAIDVLTALGASTGPVASLLEQIVSDSEEPISLRCAAAEAIGKMPTSGGQQNFDAVKTAEDAIAIAIEVGQAELNWWDAEKKREEEKKLRLLAGGGSIPGMEGYPSYGPTAAPEGYPSARSPYGPTVPGAGPGYPGSPYGPGAEPPKKPLDPRIVKTQRRLKHTLYCVKLALDGDPTFTVSGTKARPGDASRTAAEGGMLARANAQQKTRVKELSTRVVNLFAAIDKSEVEVEPFLEGLKKQLEQLQSMTGAVAAGGPPGGAAPPPGAGPGSGPPGAAPAPPAAPSASPAARNGAPSGGAAPAGKAAPGGAAAPPAAPPAGA